MSRILFIGDSHTSGYSVEFGPRPDIFIPKIWHPNNYAEIYCKKNNNAGVIYATPGVGNDRYPDWIRFCLDMYPDIDTLVLQSTYINRWMMSSNLWNTNEVDIPLDHFTIQQDQGDAITRFMDNIQKESDGHWLHHQKTYPGHMDHLYMPKVEQLEPFETTNYLQMKVFNELETVIWSNQYVRNLWMIDRMCKEHDVKIFMWRMNEDVYIPSNLDIYGELDITLERKTCVNFLQNQNINFNDHYLGEDKEHFDYAFHEAIADRFIPHLLKNV